MRMVKGKRNWKRLLLWLPLFLCLIVGFAVRLDNEKGTVTAAQRDYFVIESGDLTLTGMEQGYLEYCIYFTYKENNPNAVLPQADNYMRYNLTNTDIFATTGDGEVIQMKYVKANGTNKSLAFYFSETTESGKKLEKLHFTKLTFPAFHVEYKDETYKNNYGYEGLYFSEETCYNLTAEGNWEVESTNYIEITKEVNGVITSEQIDGSQNAYILEKPLLESGKQCLGWEIDGKLYPIGERIELNGKNLSLKAVTVDFSLSDKVSIRYNKANASGSGIRFSVEIATENLPASLKEIGIIVMPSDLLTEQDFVWENYKSVGQAKRFSVSAEDVSLEEERFTLYASILSVLETNYNRSFIARAYALVSYSNNEEGYVWEDKTVESSVYEIASKILEEELTIQNWQETILEGYVNKVVDITYDGVTATVLNATDNPAIDNTILQVNGNQVTMILTTETTGFWAILYNGHRVKSAYQSYSNGTLTIVFILETEVE